MELRKKIPLALAVAAMFACNAIPACSQGIPLPGITLYGVILNQDGTTPVTSGDLSLTYTPMGGGPAVTVQSQLADLPGGFSYVVTIPVEISVEGLPPDDNSIELPSSDITYTRSADVNGTVVNFKSGQDSTTLTSDQHRGVVQRVDLQATGVISTPQDVNGDETVNKIDLFLWFRSWMATTPAEYNFDRKGDIDAVDLISLLKAIKANH